MQGEARFRRLYLGSIAGPLGPATPFNGYLIDHPKGLTLIDTGFGKTLALLGGMVDPPADISAGEFTVNGQKFPWIRRATTTALADHGVEAGDIKFIINTHAGDNHLFPNATFIIQEPEVTWARQAFSAKNLTEWDFPGAKIEQLQREDVEILPGLKCIFTPGHTPGHQSVLYERDGYKMLFCGDAVYTADIWSDPGKVVPGTMLYHLQVQMQERGLETWRESVAKLAALGVDEAHFAHDSHYMHFGHRHGHHHGHG
jgi:N-acyl homoserine lactone hydrolase